MLSLYVGALVFGGILIGASVVLGGDGGDMDVDGDIAMDADLDADGLADLVDVDGACLLYTSPSPRDKRQSRMPSSA